MNLIMNSPFKNASLLAVLLFLPTLVFSQTLKLGTLSSFGAFTGVGACTNSGSFTGDIGTNDGIISGFVPPNFTGTIYNNELVTVQARIDLLQVYIHLSDIFVTQPGTHIPAFGGGETIAPGVYSVGGAGSITGTLNLDGEGDPDAVFILKFDGALSAGVGSEIVLINGTRSSNVFWIAEGAIEIGANSVIKGTLFSHPGAITLGVNCDIEGRMLSTEGAITIAAGSVASKSVLPSTIEIHCSSRLIPAAVVDVLGSVENFALFTSFGAVSNAATSGFIGDVGTDAGVISGFGTSTNIGSFYLADDITEQAKLDLDKAYNQLMLLPNTVTGHTPAFGSGETLNTGVYYIGAAGSLAGTITLDAQGDPDAIFVFKFAGAFSVAAQSKVILTNGTSRCNVFWVSGAGVATGATSMGSFTYMKGTVIAHGGACTMGANGNLEGRMLSTDGAVGFSTGVVYINPLCITAVTLPIELLSFTGLAKDTHVELHWITSSEVNNDYFNIERSEDGVNFTSISRIDGAGNSIQTLNYSTIDDRPFDGISYYRLKQTDYDGKSSYSAIEAVEFSVKNDFILEIYPNPFSIKTTVHTSKNIKASSLIVYNSYGRVVKQIKNISGQTFTFARENLLSGLYFMNLVKDNKIVATEKMVIID
ncbi:MAG: hypothetical protein ACI865_002809 [Flavobacteriaceae bacterium]|jgi:hypothetical protein